MDWKETDEKLIRRGELILDLKSLKNHRKELENMNEGRPGPRYKLADNYIQLLTAKSTLKISYTPLTFKTLPSSIIKPINSPMLVVKSAGGLELILV
jgi:hypothetical protein